MDKRVYGSEGIALVECINPRLRKYRVRWDLQPENNEKGVKIGVSFVEKEFLHKPTLDEIKDTVTAWVNTKIDEKIRSGFVWNGYAVWLSSENQFNYKAAYDLAVQSGGANLPVVFKFGDSQNPLYHKFETLTELSDFYTQAMSYISNILASGWAKKDAIDWSAWQKYL